MPTLQKPTVHRGCGHSLLHTRPSYHQPKAPADLPIPSVLAVGAAGGHRRAAVHPMPMAGATWDPWVLSCTPPLGALSNQHGTDEGPPPKLGACPSPSQLRETCWGRGLGGQGHTDQTSRLPPTPDSSGPGPRLHHAPPHQATWVHLGAMGKRPPRATHIFRTAGTRACCTDTSNTGSGTAISPPSHPSSP